MLNFWGISDVELGPHKRQQCFMPLFMSLMSLSCRAFFHPTNSSSALSVIQDLYLSVFTYGDCRLMTANILQINLNFTAFITQP